MLSLSKTKLGKACCVT